MGNFNDRGGRSGGFRGGNRGGGRPSFGGNRGGGDRREVQMHQAICDKCHKSCEVPFRPSSDKPIYCNDCFGDKRGNEAPRRDFKNRDSNRDFGNKQNFSKPSFEKSSGDDIKKQLADINAKAWIDQFLCLKKLKTQKLLALSASVKPVAKKVEKKVVSKAAEKKEVKEK